MDTTLKQALKAKAHHLQPVILLGAKGLTPALIDEIRTALSAHELIKIKMSGIEKDERKITAEAICQQTQAHLIQLIGSIAVVYRKNPKK